MALEEPEDIDELREYMEDSEDQVDVEPMDTTFPESVCVDNLPKVDENKKPKLINVLKKIFLQVGNIKKLEMPMDSGMSLGFAFIEFESKEAAALAVDRVNGYKLDKNHVFNVFPYQELNRLAALPETYVEPADEAFQEPSDLASWLADPEGQRDMFVTRYAVGKNEETMVAFGEMGRNPQSYYNGEREKEAGLTWCELEVKWSPKGSYLATYHRRGVALWGGHAMEKQGRFAHDNVNRVGFSPCERYMLTCNFRNPREGDSTVLFWDIREGKVLRKFALGFAPLPGSAEEEGRLVPNLFKWSADGQYVAHLAPQGTGGDAKGSAAHTLPNALIKIYSLPSMQLLDSKSLRAQGVMDFQWSPADNTLAYWAAEDGNTPARVSLVAIPSRADLRQKNLFSVTDCQLTWQPKGDFLAVKVVRHTKSKKTHFNNLELFRVREDLVPVETLDIKEPVTGLAWEPGGKATRFALITAEGPRPSVSFYDMGPKPGDESGQGQGGSGKAKSGAKLAAALSSGTAANSECKLLKTLGNRQCSGVYWSPVGGHCVIAGLPISNVNDYSGSLEFYDVDALPERGVEMDHYRANFVEWDPSGRMVCTAVTQPLEGMVYKFQMDNGYKLWTFQGDVFVEKQVEKFYSFSWRPRPESLLDEQATKAVVKNLRKFERKFERADREEKRKRELLGMVEMQRQRTDLRERLAARKARNYDGIRAEKAAARYGFDVDDDANYIIETKVRELVVSKKEEVVAVL